MTESIKIILTKKSWDCRTRRLQHRPTTGNHLYGTEFKNPKPEMGINMRGIIDIFTTNLRFRPNVYRLLLQNHCNVVIIITASLLCIWVSNLTWMFRTGNRNTLVLRMHREMNLK